MLEEKRDEQIEDQSSNGLEEEKYQEPRGLRRLEGEKTGEKRKDFQQRDGQLPSKKRRKLKFPILPENWGLDGNLELERIEEEEIRKTAFLKEGISDITSGKASLQLTIRKWSHNEIYFQKLCQEIIKKSSDIGSFISSLEKDLNVMKDKLQPATSNMKDSTEERNRVTTGQCSMSSCPQVSKDETTVKSNTQTIVSMFRAKMEKDEKTEIDRLEKERRLEKQKQLLRGWKEKRDHHERLRWAKEWLVDTAISSAAVLGHDNVGLRVTSVLEDLLLAIPGLADQKSSLRMARLERGMEKTKQIRLKVKRRLLAESQRKELLERLEAMWSELESGVPEAKMWKEPNPRQEERPCSKRERKPSKQEILESRLAAAISSQLVEELVGRLEIEHNCGISPACPAWWCEGLIERKKLVRNIDQLTEDIAKLQLEEIHDEMDVYACTRYDEKPELTEPESKFEHHEFDYDDQNGQNDEHGFERLKSKL